jgi:hypothetical protein
MCGEDWALFAVSTDGRTVDYYDRGTVAFPSPGIVRVTTKTVKYTIAATGGKRKSQKEGDPGREGLELSIYTITRHQIECRNGLDTFLNTAEYDRDGRVVHHSEVPFVIPHVPRRPTPLDIYPESVSENLFKIVCPQTP